MLLGIDERPSPVADAHVALSRPATPVAPTYMPSQGAQRCTSSSSRRPHLGDSVPGFIAARRVRDTAPALTGAKVGDSPLLPRGTTCLLYTSDAADDLLC